MTEHCDKEGQLSALKVSTENIDKRLSKLDTTMERFIGVLEQISAQHQQIISLQSTVSRLDSTAQDQDKRINTLEVEQAKGKVRIGFLMGGMATVSSVGTAIVTKFLK